MDQNYWDAIVLRYHLQLSGLKCQTRALLTILTIDVILARTIMERKVQWLKQKSNDKRFNTYLRLQEYFLFDYLLNQLSSGLIISQV